MPHAQHLIWDAARTFVGRAEVLSQRQLSRVEMLVWACLLVLLVALKTGGGVLPLVFNDSFVYFDAAQHALAGQPAHTSIVQFETERASGLMPAPLLTFPPGYSVAIAIASVTGLAFPQAALLVSTLATLLSLWCVARLAAWLLPSRLWVRAAVAAFLLNSYMLKYATSALSEALFIALVLLGAVALVGGLRETRSRAHAVAWMVGCGAAIGAGAWVRPTGAFFVLGLGAVALALALVRSPRAAWRPALAGAVAALPLALLLLRNRLLAGSWLGAEGQLQRHPLSELSGALENALDDLLFGSAPMAGHIWPCILFALALAAFGALIWHARLWRRDSRQQPRPSSVLLPRGVGELSVLAVSFAAGCIAVGSAAVVEPSGVRLYAPLVPFAILISLAVFAALWLQSSPATEPRWRRAVRASAVVMLGSYAVLNLGWYRDVAGLADPLRLAQRLDRVTASGVTPRSAILRAVGATGTVVATEGPMLAWVIRRPIIALVPQPLSRHEWTEPAVREVLRRYDSRVLVVNAPPPGFESQRLPSEFLAAVLNGEVPAWLEELARTPDVVVLRRRGT